MLDFWVRFRISRRNDVFGIDKIHKEDAMLAFRRAKDGR